MSEKQFLIFLIAWLIISYAILWILGGACSNPFSGGTCASAAAVASLSAIPIIGLFLPFASWGSVMYFLAPIAGFILSYFLIKWYNENFETEEASSIWFLPLIIIVLLVAHGMTLAWYYQEAVNSTNANSGGTGLVIGLNPFLCAFEPSSQSCSASIDLMNSEYVAQYQAGKTNYVFQYMKIDFWGKLRGSMFYLFMLGALAGWLPLFLRRVYENMDNDEDDKESKHDAHHKHSDHHKHQENASSHHGGKFSVSDSKPDLEKDAVFEEVYPEMKEMAADVYEEEKTLVEKN